MAPGADCNGFRALSTTAGAGTMTFLTESDLTMLLRAAPIIAALFAAPWLMRHLRRWSPPPLPDDGESAVELRRRNGWIDGIGILLFFGGFYLPLGLLLTDPALKDSSLLVVGLAFGAAAILPNLWFGLATLPFGIDRYQEFWRFFQQRYTVGRGVILGFYLTSAAIGVVSAALLSGRLGG